MQLILKGSIYNIVVKSNVVIELFPELIVELVFEQLRDFVVGAQTTHPPSHETHAATIYRRQL